MSPREYATAGPEEEQEVDPDLSLPSTVPSLFHLNVVAPCANQRLLEGNVYSMDPTAYTRTPMGSEKCGHNLGPRTRTVWMGSRFAGTQVEKSVSVGEPACNECGACAHRPSDLPLLQQGPERGLFPAAGRAPQAPTWHPAYLPFLSSALGWGGFPGVSLTSAST